MAQRPIRVLFLDDSDVTRRLCSDVLAGEADIAIVDIGADVASVWRRLRDKAVDVLVLDIELPDTGQALIAQLRREFPTPIIVFSGRIGCGQAPSVTPALLRPQTTLRSALEHGGQLLLAAIRAAAAMAALPAARSAAPRQPRRASADLPALEVRSKLNADSMLPDPASRRVPPGGARLIAIGASTGGTQALETVFAALPADIVDRLPGIVVVQHMPEKFTGMYAGRLNELCPLDVREAVNGDRVRPGLALLAPGGRHMMVKRDGNGYRVEVVDGPLVNRHKPSVDLMFRSVALASGASATGVILTGMGDDGARGMKEMHDAGARTVAQDEATCIVFGMPRVAIEMGGVDKVLPLDKIAQEIVACAGT